MENISHYLKVAEILLSLVAAFTANRLIDIVYTGSFHASVRFIARLLLLAGPTAAPWLLLSTAPDEFGPNVGNLLLYVLLIVVGVPGLAIIAVIIAWFQKLPVR